MCKEPCVVSGVHSNRQLRIYHPQFSGQRRHAFLLQRSFRADEHFNSVDGLTAEERAEMKDFETVQ